MVWNKWIMDKVLLIILPNNIFLYRRRPSPDAGVTSTVHYRGRQLFSASTMQITWNPYPGFHFPKPDFSHTLHERIYSSYDFFCRNTLLQEILVGTLENERLKKYRNSFFTVHSETKQGVIHVHSRNEQFLLLQFLGFGSWTRLVDRGTDGIIPREKIILYLHLFSEHKK